MLTDKWYSCEFTAGRVDDRINESGAKDTREGGRLVIPAI